MTLMDIAWVIGTLLAYTFLVGSMIHASKQEIEYHKSLKDDDGTTKN